MLIERLLVIGLSFLVTACATSMNEEPATPNSLEREQHRVLTEEFVQQAALGNVPELVASMARITLKANDRAALEGYLRDQIAPFFHGYSRLRWEGQYLTVKDDLGNTGVQYYEFVEISNGDARPFVITLFPEDGRHRVTNIVVGECFRGYHLTCP